MTEVVPHPGWYESWWLDEALEEAKKGLEEGGIPIGSVLIDPRVNHGERIGSVVSRGHNMRVQSGDPTAHAEVVAIRNAGRRRDWHKLVLVSTLSPCIMCTGTSLLYKIPKVVVGENVTFTSTGENLFPENNVQVVLLQDQRCIQIMTKFIEDRPDLWNEDIHEIGEKEY